MKNMIGEIWRALWPALAALLATLMVLPFLDEFTFVKGSAAWADVLVRFFRLLLILTLPLFFLPALCALAGKGFHGESTTLIQIPEKEDLQIRPLKNWLVRPLQGIGLMMLMVTKLGSLLQAYEGVTADFSALPPPGSFTVLRFANAILTSLLLSFLWTLDDLGIRQYKWKNGELRKIGKYLGVALPFLAGLYGVASLFRNQTRMEAFIYILQMILIFIPPFLIFSVLHSRYLIWRKKSLLGKLKATPKEFRVEDVRISQA